MHRNRSNAESVAPDSVGGQAPARRILAACVILLTSAHAPLAWTAGPAAPRAIAAMPLKERIALIASGLRDPRVGSVTSDAFRRAAAHTGLHVYSMKTADPVAVADPGLSAARAVIAGYDLLLDVTDADAVFWGIAAAVERGELSLDRIDAAVARVLLTARAARIATR